MNPRLLLLEDDAVSAAFLVEVLGALPAQVTHVATVSAARARAGDGHDLWLFDVRLPDGDGADLLRELRGLGCTTPALALTADHEASSLARLRRAGFEDVLPKPLTAATLRDAVNRHRRRDGLAIWDDAAALAALGGNPASMASLRGLFLQELPGQHAQVLLAARSGDVATARATLHRLKASCGFVGAAALLAEVKALSAAPDSAQALARFTRGVDALVGAAGPLSPGAAAQVRTADPRT